MMRQNNPFTGFLTLIAGEPVLKTQPNMIILNCSEQPIPDSNTATILLPPTSAVMADADGDINAFNAMYYEYLCTPQVREFIDVILQLLVRGVHVFICVDKAEAMNLNFCSVLMEFFVTMYGIVIGTAQQPFTVVPDRLYNVANELYLNNLIDTDTLLNRFDISRCMPEVFCKLNNERCLTVSTNIDDIISTWINFQNSMYTGIIDMIMPISMVRR